jgi:hypothetical protein
MMTDDPAWALARHVCRTDYHKPEPGMTILPVTVKLTRYSGEACLDCRPPNGMLAGQIEGIDRWR